MRKLIKTFMVFTILFWIGLFISFGAFVFFGAEIKDFLYGIPALVEFKEYMEFTQDSLESLAIFSTLTMIPITYIVFKANARIESGPKAVQNTVVKPPKAIKEAKVKPESSPKAAQKVKTSRKEIGLTGLIIK